MLVSPEIGKKLRSSEASFLDKIQQIQSGLAASIVLYSYLSLTLGPIRGELSNFIALGCGGGESRLRLP